MADIVRDPDTGEFRTVDDMAADRHGDRPPLPSWGGAEHQHLAWGVTQEMDDDELLAVESRQEAVGLGLDANEVAELLALDVEIALQYLTDSGSADDPTGVVGGASIGVNMSTDEDPLWRNDWRADGSGVSVYGQGEGGDFEEVGGQTGSGDSGIDGISGPGTVEVTRPGYLHGRILAPASSWEDAASSSGGAGTPVATKMDHYRFRDRFRVGPIVDQADDIVARLGIAGGESVTGRYRILCRASMAWQTVEIPGGRPDFELPDL
jgi:hypothetical protein